MKRKHELIIFWILFVSFMCSLMINESERIENAGEIRRLMREVTKLEFKIEVLSTMINQVRPF